MLTTPACREKEAKKNHKQFVLKARLVARVSQKTRKTYHHVLIATLMHHEFEINLSFKKLSK